MQRAQRTVVAVLALLASAGGATALAKDDALTPEELVSKHLASIGAAELLRGGGSLVAEGRCRFEIRRGGAGSLPGRARLSSEGQRLRLELPFDSSEYFGERVVFDGRKTEIGFIQPGRRSPLGEFLNTYDVLVKEGLLAGVLTTAWPLLDVPARKAKLKYEGLKKVEGQSLHQLAYKAAKDQGDIWVVMQFEPETFRHVRTLYGLKLRPSMAAAIDRSASQQDTRFEIEERFSDFGSADGLTLPRRWSLTFEMDGPSTDALWRWDSTFESVLKISDPPRTPAP